VNDELERVWKKRSCPNCRYYPAIYMAGLRKITKNCQNRRSPGRDLNPGPPVYKAGVGLSTVSVALFNYGKLRTLVSMVTSLTMVMCLNNGTNYRTRCCTSIRFPWLPILTLLRPTSTGVSFAPNLRNLNVRHFAIVALALALAL
jgi:hypothetical protein